MNTHLTNWQQFSMDCSLIDYRNRWSEYRLWKIVVNLLLTVTLKVLMSISIEVSRGSGRVRKRKTNATISSFPWFSVDCTCIKQLSTNQCPRNCLVMVKFGLPSTQLDIKKQQLLLKMFRSWDFCKQRSIIEM